MRKWSFRSWVTWPRVYLLFIPQLEEKSDLTCVWSSFFSLTFLSLALISRKLFHTCNSITKQNLLSYILMFSMSKYECLFTLLKPFCILLWDRHHHQLLWQDFAVHLLLSQPFTWNKWADELASCCSYFHDYKTIDRIQGKTFYLEIHFTGGNVTVSLSLIRFENKLFILPEPAQ